MDFLGFLNGSGYLEPAIWIAALVAFVILLRLSNVFRYIPNNQVGIVEKLWSAKGSIENGFIALNGEAGYEPEVLRGGLHVFFPFMYRIHKSDLVTVGQGQESGNAGLIPTAMLSSMFGRMMPDALEKLKDEAPKAGRRVNGS